MPQSYIKFYGNDWRSDPRLRLCSAASRGVWIDLITIMMEAEPFGHLLVNGAAPTEQEIAALTVTSTAVIRKAMAELAEKGVYSKTPEGVIYSRRMVKDAARLAEAREHGKRGGNPRLKGRSGEEDNAPDKPRDNGGGYGGGLTPTLIPHGKSQKPEARSHSSDPNGSGAAPPPDPIKALFDFGRAVLAEGGIADKQARALIGKWRSALGDDAKLMALFVTARNSHAQAPVPYLERAVRNETERSRHPSGYIPMHPGAGG